MIKDSRQLDFARRTIRELQEEIKNVKEKYEEHEWEFFIDGPARQIQKLEGEIEEYVGLSSESLEQAVNGRLKKPLLLEEIGELLAKIRIAAGLTQAETAARLGWQQSNLSRFENEDYQSQTIAKIAEYLDEFGVWLYLVPELEELDNDIYYQKSTQQSTSQSLTSFVQPFDISSGQFERLLIQPILPTVFPEPDDNVGYAIASELPVAG